MRCKTRHDTTRPTAPFPKRYWLEFCSLYPFINLSALAEMVVVSENRHPNSLNFANERKVIILRDQGQPYWKIRLQVKNLKKKRPSIQTVANTCHEFKRTVGQRVFRYNRCGRTAWKLTPEVKKFIIQKLLELRKKVVCTCPVLQQVVAREYGMTIEVSTIQKLLKSKGYRWQIRLPCRICFNAGWAMRLQSRPLRHSHRRHDKLRHRQPRLARN